MKKIYILLIALIALAGCACPKGKTFKNPIFYERLRGFDETSVEFEFTQNGDHFINNGTRPCELVEDNTTNILMRCRFLLDKSKESYFYIHFVSIGKIEKHPDKCVFLLFSKRCPECPEEHVGELFVPWKDCGPTEPQSKYNLPFLIIKELQ